MTKGPEGLTYAEVMELAKPREAKVRVYLDGQLAAEVDQLAADLAALKDKPGMSLADGAERARIQAELDEYVALLRESEAEFRFRALSRKDFSDLKAQHPPRDENEDWNPETFGPALVAACAIAPVMSVPEVEALYDRINEHGRAVLWSGAWRANQAAISIPS